MDWLKKVGSHADKGMHGALVTSVLIKRKNNLVHIHKSLSLS
jgi:hypothetical protein